MVNWLSTVTNLSPEREKLLASSYGLFPSLSAGPIVYSPLSSTHFILNKHRSLYYFFERCASEKRDSGIESSLRGYRGRSLDCNYPGIARGEIFCAGVYCWEAQWIRGGSGIQGILPSGFPLRHGWSRNARDCLGNPDQTMRRGSSTLKILSHFSPR